MKQKKTKRKRRPFPGSPGYIDYVLAEIAEDLRRSSDEASGTGSAEKG